MEHLLNFGTRWGVAWVGCLVGLVALSIVPGFNPPSNFDWGLHVISYFTMAALPVGWFSSRKLACICAGAIPALGLILEYVQRNITGREFSPEDMLANNIGTILGICAGIVIRFFRKTSRIAGGVQ